MSFSIQKIILIILFALLSFLLIINAFFYIFQRKFIYFPSARTDQNPSYLGLEYNDIFLKASDFLIHGWEIPHYEKLGYILYFNGNAGNIGTRLEIYKILHDLGMHIFTFDYPGFGSSTGTPSITNIKESLGYISKLIAGRTEKGKPLIIHGFSLGGAVAILYASKYPSHGIILESTFTSLNDVARVHYPFILTTLINRENYDSLGLIKEINMPKVIIHSKEDEIIPYWMGQKLYEESAEPKYFVKIGGGHNASPHYNREHYAESIKNLIDLLHPE